MHSKQQCIWHGAVNSSSAVHIAVIGCQSLKWVNARPACETSAGRAARRPGWPIMRRLTAANAVKCSTLGHWRAQAGRPPTAAAAATTVNGPGPDWPCEPYDALSAGLACRPCRPTQASPSKRRSYSLVPGHGLERVLAVSPCGVTKARRKCMQVGDLGRHMYPSKTDVQEK